MKRSEFLKIIGTGAGVVVLAPHIIARITQDADELSDWSFYHEDIRYIVIEEITDSDKMYDLISVRIIGGGYVTYLKTTLDAKKDPSYKEMIKSEAMFLFLNYKQDLVKTTSQPTHQN